MPFYRYSGTCWSAGSYRAIFAREHEGFWYAERRFEAVASNRKLANTDMMGKVHHPSEFRLVSDLLTGNLNMFLCLSDGSIVQHGTGVDNHSYHRDTQRLRTDE